MRVRLFFVFLLLVPVMALASDDPILFTVGDMSVMRSEFEQSYLKNNTQKGGERKSVADYLELYIIYKLKVKAALDAHLDATNSFKGEYARCLSESPMPSASLQKTGHVAPSVVSAIYEKRKEAAGTAGLVCLAQIYIRVPQKSRRDEQRRAEQSMEDIYRQLQGGADFGQLARQYSQDEVSAFEDGVMGWYIRGQLLKEVEDVAFGLQKGEISRPFQSTIGYHILQMVDRKQLEPYEMIREQLSSEVGQQQWQAQVGTNRINGERVESVPEVSMEENSAPVDVLQKEYFEGILLYELSKHSVGKHAAEDEQALAYYFKKNKKKYRRKGFKPKDYTEVRELVVADLQDEMDKHWVADLRKKYPVSVNKKVLKTVNNHR